MQERQWITARRSELDAIVRELAKRAQEVQAERDELVIEERVSNRLAEQTRTDAGPVAPVPAKVAGRAVLLHPAPQRRGRRGRAAAAAAGSWRSCGRLP
jgi:hypothetical protein